MIIRRIPKLKLATVGEVQKEALHKAVHRVQHFVEVVDGPLHEVDLVVVGQADAGQLHETCQCPVVLCRGDGNHQVPNTFGGGQLADYILSLFRQKNIDRPRVVF